MKQQRIPPSCWSKKTLLLISNQANCQHRQTVCVCECVPEKEGNLRSSHWQHEGDGLTAVRVCVCLQGGLISFCTFFFHLKKNVFSKKNDEMSNISVNIVFTNFVLFLPPQWRSCGSRHLSVHLLGVTQRFWKDFNEISSHFCGWAQDVVICGVSVQIIYFPYSRQKPEQNISSP